MIMAVSIKEQIEGRVMAILREQGIEPLPRDQAWVKILQYQLPDDIHDAVALIPRMLGMWEAANADGVLSMLSNDKLLMLAMARLYEAEGIEDEALIGELYRRGRDL